MLLDDCESVILIFFVQFVILSLFWVHTTLDTTIYNSKRQFLLSIAIVLLLTNHCDKFSRAIAVHIYLKGELETKTNFVYPPKMYRAYNANFRHLLLISLCSIRCNYCF